MPSVLSLILCFEVTPSLRFAWAQIRLPNIGTMPCFLMPNFSCNLPTWRTLLPLLACDADCHVAFLTRAPPRTDVWLFISSRPWKLVLVGMHASNWHVQKLGPLPLKDLKDRYIPSLSHWHVGLTRVNDMWITMVYI